jgi:hypothetical protein
MHSDELTFRGSEAVENLIVQRNEAAKRTARWIELQ